MQIQKKYIQSTLIISLLVALLASFHIFIQAFFYRDKQHFTIYNTWQFPMILAMLIECIYTFKE
jgi:hypothetical protein